MTTHSSMIEGVSTYRMIPMTSDKDDILCHKSQKAWPGMSIALRLNHFRFLCFLEGIRILHVIVDVNRR